MAASDLETVARQIVELARQRGFVVAREVREELTRAGLAETQWKEVLALANPPLAYRRGRYHHPAGAEETPAGDLAGAVQAVLDHHRADVSRIERREQGRVEFVQPVVVLTEEGRSHTLLTRDLSATGIRLISTRRLLGQKLRVVLPAGTDEFHFVVRILWTCPLGDDLVESGGSFLEVQRRPKAERNAPGLS
ncbi:MAG: PilZ domain-containing protein [Gemmataceae bacterium]